jgi:hypothetical protein
MKISNKKDVAPELKKEAVEYQIQEEQLSTLKVCKLIGLSRLNKIFLLRSKGIECNGLPQHFILVLVWHCIQIIKLHS